jgi:hypothetical protein
MNTVATGLLLCGLINLCAMAANLIWATHNWKCMARNVVDAKTNERHANENVEQSRANAELAKPRKPTRAAKYVREGGKS